MLKTEGHGMGHSLLMAKFYFFPAMKDVFDAYARMEKKQTNLITYPTSDTLLVEILLKVFITHRF